jgi:hypothetical protein
MAHFVLGQLCALVYFACAPFSMALVLSSRQSLARSQQWEWHTVDRMAIRLRSVESDNPPPSAVSLSLQAGDSLISGSSCAYEAVQIYWNWSWTTTSSSSSSSSHPLDCMLAVENVATSQVSLQTLHNANTPTVLDATERDSSEFHGVIRCSLNEQHCVPGTMDIIALTSDPTNLRLAIHFNTNTTEPPLRSNAELINALHFDPPILGAASSTWRTPTLLEVSITETYFGQIMSYINAGKMVSITVRSNDIMQELETLLAALPQQEKPRPLYMTVTPTERSQLRLYVVDSRSMAVISNTVTLDVDICPANLLPKSSELLHRNPSSANSLVVTGRSVVAEAGGSSGRAVAGSIIKMEAVVHMKGIFPVVGTRPLVFPGSLPALVCVSDGILCD